jgi:hypothetical protein
MLNGYLSIKRPAVDGVPYRYFFGTAKQYAKGQVTFNV